MTLDTDEDERRGRRDEMDKVAGPVGTRALVSWPIMPLGIRGCRPHIDARRDTPEELRKNVHYHRVVESLVVLERFSKWNRMLRAVTFVIHFVANIRRRIPKETGPLTQEELAEAERVLIRQIQGKAYDSEITSLRKQAIQKHPWKKVSREAAASTNLRLSWTTRGY